MADKYLLLAFILKGKLQFWCLFLKFSHILIKIGDVNYNQEKIFRQFPLDLDVAMF